MQWLNEPAQWAVADGALTVRAEHGTDFWRTTHYGYVRDSGHAYGDWYDGDLDLEVRVAGRYTHQYDQAGAMVRVDDRHWVKTGIEYVDGRIRLSTVITLDYSSWAVAELPAGGSDLGLHLTRRGDSVEVRYAVDDGQPELASVVYLPPGAPAFAGLMCAAPEGPGFDVTFYNLVIRRAGAP